MTEPRTQVAAARAQRPCDQCLRHPARTQQGFHYVEIIIAILLIAVSIAPMGDALRSGMLISAATTQDLSDQYWLSAKLEEVLAQPFGQLDSAATLAGSSTTATSYSDAGGSSRRRLVYLSRYDADNADNDNNGFTGVDAGLIWVKVKFEASGMSLESLVGS